MNNIADFTIEIDPDPNHYTPGNSLISPPLNIPFFGLSGAGLSLYLCVSGHLYISEERLVSHRITADKTEIAGHSLWEERAWFRFEDDLRSNFNNTRPINLTRIPIAFYEAHKIEEEEKANE